MKLSTKLTALFTLIFLIIGIITSYFVYTSEVKRLENNIKEELKEHASQSMDQIDRMLFERSTDIKILAADPVIISRSSSPMEIHKRLMVFKDSYKFYDSLSFFDLNRVRITDTAGIKIGEQHPLTEYWPHIEKGMDYVFDVSESNSLKKEVLHFASVVKDRNGSPFGVVVSRMSMEHIDDILTKKIGIHVTQEAIDVDLVSNDGLLLYSDYNKKGILNDIPPDWELIKKIISAGKKIGSERYNPTEREEEIFSFVCEKGYLDFKGNNWTLIMHTPTRVAFASAIELRNRIIIIFSITSIVAFFIILYFSYTITLPVERLSTAVIEIGKGNLEVEVKTTDNGEIGKLASLFNKMTKDLRESRENGLRYRREIEVQNHKIHLLSQMSELLQSCNKFEEAYTVIGQSAKQLFAADSGALYILNSSRKLVEEAAVWGDHPPKNQVFSIEDCWALRRGQNHEVSEYHSGLRCLHVEGDIKAYMCMPIIAQGEMIGIFNVLISLSGNAQSDEQLLKERRDEATSITERIGVAIANLRLRDTLKNLSVRDPLTNLFNRRYMEETLEREISRAGRKGITIGIIMLDIDHFKNFNDTFGHDIGDTILAELGKFLQKNIRGSDIACRYGGEEFMIILPDASLEMTLQRAEFLRKTVKELQSWHSLRPMKTITLSFGIAVFPEHGQTIEKLLKASDTALYQAKKEGRNRVCIGLQSLSEAVMNNAQ